MTQVTPAVRVLPGDEQEIPNPQIQIETPYDYVNKLENREKGPYENRILNRKQLYDEEGYPKYSQFN